MGPPAGTGEDGGELRGWRGPGRPLPAWGYLAWAPPGRPRGAGEGAWGGGRGGQPGSRPRQGAGRGSWEPGGVTLPPGTGGGDCCWKSEPVSGSARPHTRKSPEPFKTDGRCPRRRCCLIGKRKTSWGDGPISNGAENLTAAHASPALGVAPAEGFSRPGPWGALQSLSPGCRRAASGYKTLGHTSASEVCSAASSGESRTGTKGTGSFLRNVWVSVGYSCSTIWNSNLLLLLLLFNWSSVCGICGIFWRVEFELLFGNNIEGSTSVCCINPCFREDYQINDSF